MGIQVVWLDSPLPTLVGIKLQTGNLHLICVFCPNMGSPFGTFLLSSLDETSNFCYLWKKYWCRMQMWLDTVLTLLVLLACLFSFPCISCCLIWVSWTASIGGRVAFRLQWYGGEAAGWGGEPRRSLAVVLLTWKEGYRISLASGLSPMEESHYTCAQC